MAASPTTRFPNDRRKCTSRAFAEYFTAASPSVEKTRKEFEKLAAMHEAGRYGEDEEDDLEQRQQLWTSILRRGAPFHEPLTSP